MRVLKSLLIAVVGALVVHGLPGPDSDPLAHLAKVSPTSTKVTKNMIYLQAAKSPSDQQIVANLLPSTFVLRQLDQLKHYDLTTTSSKLHSIHKKELELVKSAIEEFGLHTEHFSDLLNLSGQRAQTLNSKAQSLKLLADFYYRMGHLRLTTDVLYD